MDGRRRAPRPGPPQLPAARAARPQRPSRSTPTTGRAARTGVPGPSCASTPPRPTPTTCRSSPPASPGRRAARSSAARPSEDVAEPAARLAAAAGWPLLAEPTSGVRCGPHDRSHVVAHYDVLLRAGRFADAHAPGLVLRVGDMPTSKPLRAWAARAAQVVLDPHAAWHEPTRARRAAAAQRRRAGARRARRRRRAARPRAPTRTGSTAGAPPTPSRRAALAEAPDPFEPKLLAALEPELPDGAIVWLSSSMPVRDVEAFFPQSPKRLRFLANRGANGIDGVVSSAAGAALAASGSPAWLLTGELALLHDLGGLLAARRAGRRPARSSASTTAAAGSSTSCRSPSTPTARAYEEHIATPVAVDLGALAPEVREIRTDRATNVELHRQAVERVERAPLGPCRRVALGAARRVDDRRVPGPQARVLLVLEERPRRHEAGRRGVAARAGRVALLAAARGCSRSSRSRRAGSRAGRRSGRRRRCRAPMAAAWCAAAASGCR